MSFAAPWLLLALPLLPALWWLLRITPPQAQRERFPALRLLAGLEMRQQTPARTPWPLWLLRLLAVLLLVLGLAGPQTGADGALPGQGTVLLVVDNGWSSAADWPARLQAAAATLDQAQQDGRAVALLTTADAADGTPPRPGPALPARQMRPLLNRLVPLPWATDRGAAARSLAGARFGSVVYLADGLAGTPADDAAFARALGRLGPVTEQRGTTPSLLLMPPRSFASGLVLPVQRLAPGLAQPVGILAETGDGRVLARATAVFAPGATQAEASLSLPVEIANQLARLVLADSQGAGSVVLLDERWRRRAVGLVAPDATSAETPLSGSLFYLRNALLPSAELRSGSIEALLARPISVLILADIAITTAADRAAVQHWVAGGGVLVRFAGPHLLQALAQDPAAAPGGMDTGDRPPDGPANGLLGGADDGLLPVKLLAGARQLGGAMSWGKPAGLGPFPPGSPFAGLAVPPEVTISRQLLAQPSAELAPHVWASVADGTPLVTARRVGAGQIVLFHVTANAEWSNLPLSGLFVEMLRRLVQLSAGIAPTPGDTPLAPVLLLDGFGQPSAPQGDGLPAARALREDEIGQAPASPQHPPGIYAALPARAGPNSDLSENAQQDRAALNLSANLPPLLRALRVAGAQPVALGSVRPRQEYGPWLLAAALALLIGDMLLGLALRGLLRPMRAGLLLGALLLPGMGAARAADLPADYPALVTRLAYLQTGDAAVDDTTRAGLAGLSATVNRVSAATLGPPKAVRPGEDDLSFYPLLYWAVAAEAPPDRAAIAALNAYMSHGGILLVDTRGDDAAAAALPAQARGLDVPALAPLSANDVLAHSFYLLRGFPGRLEGAPVWAEAERDRDNDEVTPILLGANDWAAAWAMAETLPTFSMRPGRADAFAAATPDALPDRPQMALRFGVNLVIYTLTGNYKADQMHVPAILQRLGQ